MEWEDQDQRINDLEKNMPPPQTGITGWERHDWRPISQLISEIGAAFKTVRYPTGQQKRLAWERHAALRDEANRRRNVEQEGFEGQSSWYCGVVMDKCNGITWSTVTDTIFFFDPTTVEQVKLWGGYLHDAIQYYKEIKHLLVKPDRERCREKFDEVRESHERFWGQYRDVRERKRQEHQERQQQWEERQHTQKQQFIQKIRSNLEKNQDRLEKAEGALERVEANMREQQEKLDETTSEKWQRIFQERIDQGQEKINDITESIKRIQNWIAEDEEKLKELEE